MDDGDDQLVPDSNDILNPDGFDIVTENSKLYTVRVGISDEVRKSLENVPIIDNSVDINISSLFIN